MRILPVAPKLDRSGRRSAPWIALLGFVLLTQAVAGMYDSFALEPRLAFQAFQYLGACLALSIWYLQECRLYPHRQEFSGLLWLTAWPLVIPIYLVRTRGWTYLALTTVAAVAASYLGYKLGYPLAWLIYWIGS